MWGRLLPVLAAGAACLGTGGLLAACGGSRSAPPPPRVTVRLSVDGPSDRATTLDGSVSVTGTVAPAGATVLVAGQAARVQAGMFWASVPIRPGTNVIDVLAGAPDASPAVAAVRVYRELPVSVPRLGGDSPAAAVAALGKLGLQAKVVDVGGFLQSLIPTSTQVCQTSPSAGADLAPGGQVQVQVAKLC